MALRYAFITLAFISSVSALNLRHMKDDKDTYKNTDTCLCIWDIDRTLTGLQDDITECPDNKLEKNIPDCGYDGGHLTLSVVAQNLGNTFCKDCFMGIVSAGTACGPDSPERSMLVNLINITGNLMSDTWSEPGTVTSPLVTSYEDGQKQVAVQGIVEWHQENGHFDTISKQNVHMFDDRVSNIAPFKDTGFSAHQISCQTRDPNHDNLIGLCGAVLPEIVPTPGVSLCDD